MRPGLLNRPGILQKLLQCGAVAVSIQTKVNKIEKERTRI